jgi:alpha-tubulin suppressor-like RCC1 family protein
MGVGTNKSAGGPNNFGSQDGGISMR